MLNLLKVNEFCALAFDAVFAEVASKTLRNRGSVLSLKIFQSAAASMAA
jgi:hypothetical protein